MTGDATFDSLFAEERELFECEDDSSFSQRRIASILGEPGSITYVEATLAGTALVDPWNPVLPAIYQRIAPTELLHWAFRKTWEACTSVSSQQPPAEHAYRKEASLERVAHWLWIDAKRPGAQLPDTARIAISLSGQFVSAANALAIERQYRTMVTEKRIAGEIQEIAAGLRAGDYTAAQCLDRFVLLHERVSVHGH